MPPRASGIATPHQPSSLPIRSQTPGSYPVSLAIALRTAAESLASARKLAAASRIITWSSERAKFMAFFCGKRLLD
jgi:hypothetical protein